jgi:hypothetical protein
MERLWQMSHSCLGTSGPGMGPRWCVRDVSAVAQSVPQAKAWARLETAKRSSQASLVPLPNRVSSGFEYADTVMELLGGTRSMMMTMFVGRLLCIIYDSSKCIGARPLENPPFRVGFKRRNTKLAK